MRENLFADICEVLDQSPYILFFITHDLHKPPLHVNRACEEIIGYTREEFTTKITPYTIIHPAEREKAKTFIENNSPPFEYTFKVVCKDGSIKWIRCAFHKIYLDQAPALSAIGLEITNYLEDREVLKAIIDLMDEGIAVMDKDLRIIRANRVIKNLVAPDKSWKEIIGNRCFKIVYNREQPCEDCPTVKAIETKRPQAKLVHLRNRNREWYFEVKSKPVMDESGYVIGAVEYVRDITAQKLREKHILREERIRILEKIAGGIAHDFNNILGVITAAVSVIKTSIKNEKLLPHIEAIERASIRAQEIVKQFFHIGSGEEIVKKKVNLKRLIKEVIHILSYGLDTVINLENGEDIEVEVDPVQFSRVLQNIIINAIEAVEEKGEGQVNVKIKRENSKIKIEIADTGIGMDEKTMKRIFEPFFTTKLNGTGMGLAVAYSIVKKHNGEIDVKSKPGEGTTFTITIPEAQKDDKDERRILIMEDSASLRKIIKLYLENRGYQVIDISSKDELLRIVGEQSDIDVFVLDEEICNNTNLFQEIKALRERYPEAKFILITGILTKETELKAKEHGFHLVLPKPFTMDKLEKAIKEA